MLLPPSSAPFSGLRHSWRFLTLFQSGKNSRSQGCPGLLPVFISGNKFCTHGIFYRALNISFQRNALSVSDKKTNFIWFLFFWFSICFYLASPAWNVHNNGRCKGIGSARRQSLRIRRLYGSVHFQGGIAMKDFTGKDLFTTTTKGIKLYVKLSIYKIIAKYVILATLFSLGALAASAFYILVSRMRNDHSWKTSA